LLINEALKYQRGLIITDDVAVDPILDFELYRNAIVNIIKNSYPKFTIGIFGEWGAGKTTLMKSIEKEFEKDFEKDKENIICVWFDAWKYENEKEFKNDNISQ
jgi:predicted KAP-like P-loop ATPase